MLTECTVLGVQVENAVIPDPSVAAEFFSGPDEGPFVMVNLLRAIEHHRATGLAGQLNIRTRPQR